MKNYMLLFKGTNYSDLGLSPEELQGRLGNWWEWSKKLEEKGILTGGDALQDGIRTVDGPSKVVTDKSSAELKEVIGGYFLITVKDINEATEIAKNYPDFDLPNGSVEIREIMKYDY